MADEIFEYPKRSGHRHRGRCGTGTFALLLADRGLEVTGVDPAGGS
jgi:hypothetical protein